MALPNRKQIRLPDYDYSSPGAYFVTICTKDRAHILSDITVGAAISRPQDEGVRVLLSPYGEIVEQTIESISSVYPQISVDHYVIMPNHVHLLLRIREDDGGRMISAPTISTVVGQMKRYVSKQVGTALWQKSFHEHVVRGEQDYREIWNYIDGNPARWAEDRYYIE